VKKGGKLNREEGKLMTSEERRTAEQRRRKADACEESRTAEQRRRKADDKLSE
jgi:hypothetical protein